MVPVTRLMFIRRSVFAAVALLCVTAIAATILRNAGVLMLRDSIMLDNEDIRGQNPSGWTYETGPYDNPISEMLIHAVDFAPRNWSSRWALGRAELWTGNFAEAAMVLHELAQKDPRNPLVYMDTMVALSKGGLTSEIVETYESNVPPVQTQTLSDTVAIAYLALFDATNNGQERQYMLEQAHRLRPHDIYTNYMLWEDALASGSTDDSETLWIALRNFDVESVAPTDERLLDYAMRVVPFLLQRELWSYEQTKNMIAYFVWKHFDSAVIESTIKRLMVQRPGEPDWIFYLAELYHRRGDLARARTTYLNVIELAPSYAFAYLRLGMLAEATCATATTTCAELEDALDWYVRYHSFAPNDLRVVEKLSNIPRILGKPEVVALPNIDFAPENDRRAVAEILGIPEINVELGPNLVSNADFQTWAYSIPDSWDLGIYSGADRNLGVYVAGNDLLAGENGTARIMSLRSGKTPEGAVSYGEYIGEPFTVTNAKYLVTVEYAAESTQNVDLFLAGSPSRHDVAVLTKVGIPTTGGQFTRIRVLADGPSVKSLMKPLIRNWGAGQLWIDQIEIRQVIRGTDVTP